MTAYAHLERDAADCVRRNASLAPYVSYRVGGPADILAEPQNRDQLARVLRAAHQDGRPLVFLGAGTNMLVRDGGIRGVVVRLGREFRRVEVEGARIRAGAAATMTVTATQAERAGLSGLEFGFDIPGSVGGAAAMNAGAHGAEVRDILAWVEGFTLEGDPVRVDREEITFTYRKAIYPLEIVVTQVVFKLTEGNPSDLRAKREAYRERRLATQPKGKSVGSVFMNPPGDHAGRLIEAAGLKGHRIGGAQVSEKHANFILNDHDASARDIEALIREIQQRVLDRFGVHLHTEVKILGEETSSLELGGGQQATPKG